jgi:hypothetical protein
MTPTAKLRFVEQGRPTGGTIRKLQQWWEEKYSDIHWLRPEGEWRDVPLEKEECCGNPFKCMGNCHG